MRSTLTLLLLLSSVACASWPSELIKPVNAQFLDIRYQTAVSNNAASAFQADSQLVFNSKSGQKIFNTANTASSIGQRPNFAWMRYFPVYVPVPIPVYFPVYVPQHPPIVFSARCFFPLNKIYCLIQPR